MGIKYPVDLISETLRIVAEDELDGNVVYHVHLADFGPVPEDQDEDEAYYRYVVKVQDDLDDEEVVFEEFDNLDTATEFYHDQIKEYLAQSDENLESHRLEHADQLCDMVSNWHEDSIDVSLIQVIASLIENGRANEAYAALAKFRN